jgi:hypothetical protein
MMQFNCVCGYETWSSTLRIFESKREWRKLHNEGLHNLPSSPSAIKVTKSRRIILAGLHHDLKKLEMHTQFWLEDLRSWWQHGILPHHYTASQPRRPRHKGVTSEAWAKMRGSY